MNDNKKALIILKDSFGFFSKYCDHKDQNIREKFETLYEYLFDNDLIFPIDLSFILNNYWQFIFKTKKPLFYRLNIDLYYKVFGWNDSYSISFQEIFYIPEEIFEKLKN